MDKLLNFVCVIFDAGLFRWSSLCFNHSNFHANGIFRHVNGICIVVYQEFLRIVTPFWLKTALLLNAYLIVASFEKKA